VKRFISTAAFSLTQTLLRLRMVVASLFAGVFCFEFALGAAQQQQQQQKEPYMAHGTRWVAGTFPEQV
jgi:hypothetical protein